MTAHHPDVTAALALLLTWTSRTLMGFSLGLSFLQCRDTLFLPAAKTHDFKGLALNFSGTLAGLSIM